MSEEVMDKELKCADCGHTFAINEQAFHLKIGVASVQTFCDDGSPNFTRIRRYEHLCLSCLKKLCTRVADGDDVALDRLLTIRPHGRLVKLP